MIDTNYLSFNDFESDGVTTEWDISLAGNRPDAEDGTTPYIDAADIKAVQITLAEDDFTSDVYTPLDCAPVDGLPNRFTVTPAAPVGTITRIYRQTQNLYNLVDFQDLSSFTANTMDLAVRQLLFVAQEAHDLGMLAMNTNRALCTTAEGETEDLTVYEFSEAPSNTIDVSGGKRYIQLNSTASLQTLTNFTGGVHGQELFVHINGFEDWEFDFNITGPLIGNEQNNYVAVTNDMLYCKNFSGDWYCLIVKSGYIF
jgi:hypothetical protein